MTTNRAFIYSLVSEGIVTEKDVKLLMKKFKGDAFSILLFLIDQDGLKKNDLGRMWGDSLNVAYVDLENILFQSKIVELLPEKIAKKTGMIPLYQYGEVITIATSDPMNEKVLSEVEKIIKHPISVVFALPDDIDNAIQIQYRSGVSIEKYLKAIPKNILYNDASDLSAEIMKRIAWEKSVVDFTQALIMVAVKERVSVVHIENQKDKMVVRFRVDGLLRDHLTLPAAYYHLVSARLKLMAKLDYTSKRKMQSGRLSIGLEKRSLDFLISIMPTVNGEKIVLKLLNKFEDREVPDLEELDFSKSVFDRITSLVRSPGGLFLVSGPPGSGKTTVLYSILKYLNSREINIMTVEDPVEFNLPGINQVRIGLNMDYASILQSLMEQDPDIVLIGEIRDPETAGAAVQEALSGCLILSTIHASSATRIIPRLMEMGIDPFLAAASFIGGMSLRMIRRICTYCKEPYVLPDNQARKYFEMGNIREVTFYKGKGCAECNGTGYMGQIPIHELLLMNPELRSMAAGGNSIFQIEKTAEKTGLISMRYDGMKKVLRGLTTIDELNRVTAFGGDM